MVASIADHAFNADVVGIPVIVVPRLRTGLDDLLGDELQAATDGHELAQIDALHVLNRGGSDAPRRRQVSVAVDDDLSLGAGQPGRFEQERPGQLARRTLEVLQRAHRDIRRTRQPVLPPGGAHLDLVARTDDVRAWTAQAEHLAGLGYGDDRELAEGDNRVGRDVTCRVDDTVRHGIQAAVAERGAPFVEHRRQGG